MTDAHRVARARLGIDFGTSSTVAVVALPQRDPRPLLFDGSPLLPSAVCVDPTGRILVGRDALHTAMSIPEAFEPYPKQRIDDGTVLLGGAEIAVSRLYQAVLDRVVSDARHVTGRLAGEPLDVVLTCPAAWGRQRRATLLAAAPPGARLVDEPVAAAHHFVDLAGTDLADGRTAVVYDLGAGTFDAAVVRRTGDGFAVIAAEGVADCGGLDIDAAIVRHLAAAVPDAAAWHRLNQPVTAVDRRARQQLWENVRAGKEMLSRTALTHIHLPILEVDAPLGRETLDELAAPIIERTVATVRAALRGPAWRPPTSRRSCSPVDPAGCRRWPPRCTGPSASCRAQSTSRSWRSPRGACGQLPPRSHHRTDRSHHPSRRRRRARPGRRSLPGLPRRSRSRPPGQWTADGRGGPGRLAWPPSVCSSLR